MSRLKAVDQAVFFHRDLWPRVTAREWLDEASAPYDVLAENLDDLARVNRWFRTAEFLGAMLRARGARTVLDVGCGGADLTAELLRLAECRGVVLDATACDRSAEVLELASARTAGLPGLHLRRAEGEALPFDDGAFDVALCNLTLHHCDPDDAVRLLAEMRRVASGTALVCDLRRSPLAYGGAFVLARLLSPNPLTRHDAPLSVRRAYTPREALGLASAAGWHRPVVRRLPFFRMLLYDA